jgi:uncharacterized protein YjdB
MPIKVIRPLDLEIQDTFVRSDKPTNYYNEDTALRAYNLPDQNRIWPSFVEIDILSILNRNNIPVENVKNIKLGLYTVYYENGAQIIFKPIISEWKSRYVTYRNQPSTSSESVSFYIKNDGYSYYDLTRFWNNNSLNVSIEGNINTLAYFFSSNKDSDSYSPKIEIEYAPTVTGISLDKNNIFFDNKESKELIANIEPVNAINKLVHWSSTNNEIATVDSDGIVTAIKSGEAIIKAISDQGGFISECSVTVSLNKYLFEEDGFTKTFDLNSKTWTTINPNSRDTKSKGISSLDNLIQNTSKSFNATNKNVLSSGNTFKQPVNLKSFKTISSIKVV